MQVWCNGSHDGLKIRCLVREGSTPSTCTNRPCGQKAKSSVLETEVSRFESELGYKNRKQKTKEQWEMVK